MPQEPWKRASQLQRAVPREARGGPTPPPLPPRPVLWPWLLLVLVPIVLAGWFYWETVAAVWMRLADKDGAKLATPATVRSVKKAENTPTITADRLDEGLGIGLMVYEDYHTVLEKTKDRGIEWKFTASGNTLRLSAPGVKVYAEGKNITAYTLNFDEIWAEEGWSWWWDELAKAGLSEKTTNENVDSQGGTSERISLYGTRSIHQNKGWATPAYELTFFQGKLDVLRGGIKPGPGPTEPAGR